MAFIGDRVRTMDALLWQPEGSIGPNGILAYCEPRPIKVWWIDVIEERLTLEGTTYTTQSKIFVGEPIPRGAYLKLGNLDDMQNYNDPSDPVRCGAFRVVEFRTITHPKGKKIVRIAYL